LDCLNDVKHASHFCISESIEEVKLLKPERAYFTGFSHRIDHDGLCNALKEERELGCIALVEPAYDGLKIYWT
jgi:phosphoribosyl 1,2-cyclic phosphodiesterase